MKNKVKNWRYTDLDEIRTKFLMPIRHFKFVETLAPSVKVALQHVLVDVGQFAIGHKIRVPHVFDFLVDKEEADFVVLEIPVSPAANDGVASFDHIFFKDLVKLVLEKQIKLKYIRDLENILFLFSTYFEQNFGGISQRDFDVETIELDV